METLLEETLKIEENSKKTRTFCRRQTCPSFADRSWEIPVDGGQGWEDGMKPRTKKMSAEDDPAMRMFELELFKFCKPRRDSSTASAGVLLKEMEKMGVLREDPRLGPIIKRLKQLCRSYLESGEREEVFWEEVAEMELDFQQFVETISSSFMLVSKTFKGQLVIPQFQEFSRNISDIFSVCAGHKSGAVSSSIPSLAQADSSNWGVSICTVDGQRYSQGDCQHRVSLQAASMPFTYALSLAHLGSERVAQLMGEEPSGRCCDEIALDANRQPHNPMINSGAILSAAMLLYLVRPEMSNSEKFEFVQNFFSRMAGGLPVGFQNTVFLSSRESSDRNHALAYFMREAGCFPNVANCAAGPLEIGTVVDFYLQLCSLEMTTESMSVMAATLANGGVCPVTSERVLDSDAVRSVLSLMYSCGMNNYSGQFAFRVGLPAKSGVSGITLVVVPNVMGFATWSPALDSRGNSARGVLFCQQLVKHYRFHMFDNLPAASCGKVDPTVQQYESRSQRVVQVLLAASGGDRVALERAHLAGLDMAGADYDGRTALHLAACEGHLACVRYLLEVCHVEAGPEDRWGHTPLWDAQMFSKKEVATYLKKQSSLQRMHSSLIKEEAQI